MKKLLFSIIIFGFILIPTEIRAETIYKAENFLSQTSLGKIVKTTTSNQTTDGGQTVTTTYEDGSTMTIMPNKPYTQIITWTLSNGAVYQTKPNTADQFVQKQAPREAKTATKTATKLPSGSTDSVLDQIVPKSMFKGEPLNKLLNQLFYVGLVIAVILALVMIIRGGVEYMTIDAISSKESGKNRIKAALGGLLLAFSAILILNTINPSLTKLSIVFPEIEKLKEVLVDGVLTSGTRPPTGPTGNPTGEGPINPLLTAYSPRKGGDSMEGGYESSKPGLDGQFLVRTLDDYANGGSGYVTLAGDPSLYGKSYTIPQITYKNSSGQSVTLTNVKGYVHDTGSAFTGKGSSRIDIPVGKDYSSNSLNSQPFSKQNIQFIPIE